MQTTWHYEGAMFDVCFDWCGMQKEETAWLISLRDGVETRALSGQFDVRS